MATNAEIAQMLLAGGQSLAPAQGPGDLTFHMGVIQAWDELSGVNTVVVNGVGLSNLKTVQPGIGSLYSAGDVVALMRFQSTYFVFGRIGSAGAGNANQIRSIRVASLQTVTATSFGDIGAGAGQFGPDLQNVYIGSSRRCLVLHSAELTIAPGTAGGVFQAVQVTGASNFAVETAITDCYSVTPNGLDASFTATTLVTSVEGLNQGFHRFTCKYKKSGTALAQVNNRILTVIPF